MPWTLWWTYGSKEQCNDNFQSIEMHITAKRVQIPPYRRPERPFNDEGLLLPSCTQKLSEQNSFWQVKHQIYHFKKYHNLIWVNNRASIWSDPLRIGALHCSSLHESVSACRKLVDVPVLWIIVKIPQWQQILSSWDNQRLSWILLVWFVLGAVVHHSTPSGDQLQLWEQPVHQRQHQD